MAQSEIDAVRALLRAKPRPVGWPERRKRIDEVGANWPVANDVQLTAVDINGIPGEYSIVPGSDPSRVLMFFHGGGYCSGSIKSHRRLVTEAGRADVPRELVSLDPQGAEKAADWANVQSPEAYVGYERAESFASPGDAVRDRRQRGGPSCLDDLVQVPCCHGDQL